jgi:adenylosuccinate synthase
MQQQAYIVTDIGYGDAGKGTTVDYLVRQANSAVVIRHNGGPQAAHNVVTPDGRHHTFSQFGSGSFVPGTATHLSRFMLVNPLNMMREAVDLQQLGCDDIWTHTSVDEQAIVILPWHRAANKLRELARGEGRHGSCGQGIGEAKADERRDPSAVVRVNNLRDPYWLASNLRRLRAAKYRQLLQELDVPGSPAAAREWSVFHDDALIPWLCEEYTTWTKLIRIVPGNYLAGLAEHYDTLVFEGAQGVLLDESYGFHPYTTWSNTTPRNALMLLRELDYTEPITRLGVLRAYTTRHGAGPFVTEDPELAIPLAEYHNGVGEWQGAFRYGHLDLVGHSYAAAACDGLDALVVTGLDRLSSLADWQYCVQYSSSEMMPADTVNYFNTTTDGSISSIKLGVYGDRSYQSRLTELVSQCSPSYQTIPSSGSNTQEQERELLRTIQDSLGLRVSIASYGPTAVDKQAFVAY